MTPLPFITTWVWDREKREHLETQVQPTVIFRDGMTLISGEDGNGFIDYYGEYRDGFPYIHEDLEKWAAENNGYWEWENPGAIYFVEN